MSEEQRIMQKFVICPKHGEHPHSITSNIKGHKGVWCQICWTESLGESMPFIEKPFKFEETNE